MDERGGREFRRYRKYKVDLRALDESRQDTPDCLTASSVLITAWRVRVDTRCCWHACRRTRQQPSLVAERYY